MSVRLSAWSNSAPTRRISMKFDIWVFLGKLLKLIENSSLTKIGQESRALYKKTNIFFLSYLAHFFLE